MKNQPEYDLQVAVADFLKRQFPRVAFLSDVRAAMKLTIPQQVRSKKIQADGFACPDMMIFRPSGVYSAMFLELKADNPFRKNGVLKKDEHLERQAAAIERLRSSGYHADFYWQAEQAFEAIKAYMSGRPFRQIELTLAGRMAEAFR